MTYKIYMWNPLTNRPFKLFIHNVETKEEAAREAYKLYPRHELKTISVASDAETIK